MKLPMKDLTEVRKGLHFAASFLTGVWERTQDQRADEALDRIGDMRYEYDEAWKAQAVEEGLLEAP